MIHLYGSKHMSRIYDQLSRGDNVSTECFQYVDGLNLTPMHFRRKTRRCFVRYICKRRR